MRGFSSVRGADIIMSICYEHFYYLVAGHNYIVFFAVNFMAIRQGRYYAVASTAMRGPSYEASSLEATPTGLTSPARHVLGFVDHYLQGFLGIPRARLL